MSHQPPPQWKCKDGRVVEVRDMDVDHVKNCIAMLRRAGYISKQEHNENMPNPAIGFSCDSMASYYADASMDFEFDEWAKQKFTPWIDLFERELKRRGH